MKLQLLSLIIFLSMSAAAQTQLKFTISEDGTTCEVLPATCLTGTTINLVKGKPIRIVIVNGMISDKKKFQIQASNSDKLVFLLAHFTGSDTLQTNDDFILAKDGKSISLTSRVTFTFPDKSFTFSFIANPQPAPAYAPPIPNQWKPGIAVYDAMALAHVNTALTSTDFFTIMNYYFGGNVKKIVNGSIMEDSIKNNPFLKTINFDTTNFKPDLTARAHAANYNSIVSSALSSVGGLDVTNIADGFAQFIVKRTKQELDMTFFGKFKDLISSDEYKDLQTVFPQTYSAMLVVGDEIYNYQAYLQTLKEAFNNDLSTLPAHLPTIIDNHPDFFKRYPSLAATLQSGCYIANELNDKKHVGDIINDYPTEYLNSLNPNLKASVQTLQIVSASLRDTAQSPDSAYWVSTAKIKALVKDDIAFQIYLGLIYQQVKNDTITFRQGKPGNYQYDILANIFDSLKITGADFQACKNYITGFGDKANKLSRMMKNYHKLNSDSLTTEQYTAYFDASVDVLQYASQVSTIIPKAWQTDPEKTYLYHLKDTLSEYFDIAHSATHIVLDINRKNYGLAVMDVVHVYDVIYSAKASKEPNTGEKMSKSDYNENINIVSGGQLAGKANQGGRNALMSSIIQNRVSPDDIGNSVTKAYATVLLKQQNAKLLPAQINILSQKGDSLSRLHSHDSINNQLDITTYRQLSAAVVKENNVVLQPENLVDLANKIAYLSDTISQIQRWNDSINNEIKKLMAAINDTTLTDEDKKIIDAVTAIQGQARYNDVVNSKNVMQGILKYGTFMATLVQAKDADEAEAAIESFALPPGSSRIKRVSPFNVSINAYAGLFYGYEKVQGLAQDKPFTSLSQLNATGVTAPIGVSISRGNSFFFVGRCWGWSSSVFISVFDLGAVTTFRFNSNNDTVKQVPNIQLKDILSPGLFFSLGIPKCPLSVNFGAQLGPNLRDVSKDANTYANNLYWRYSMSIVVDLPVLNLYTKSSN